jgi:hypothetical protein
MTQRLRDRVRPLIATRTTGSADIDALVRGGASTPAPDPIPTTPITTPTVPVEALKAGAARVPADADDQDNNAWFRDFIENERH